MDGRQGMTLTGSAQYYLHRGVGGSGAGQGGSNPPSVTAPGFRTLGNPNVQVQSIVRGSGPVGSAFNVEGSQPNFAQGFTVTMSSGGGGGGGGSVSEPTKKKRGRPRKYGPDGSGAGAASGSGSGAVALGLSPMSSPISGTPSEKRKRGRPPGSGRKQRLANVGEWMSNSAGLAFTPHVLYVSPGEDIASKILSFSQQRPRALCIMSASGGVAAVTLRQPGSSGGMITYEGRFEILCLSGSYLVDEIGSPRNRTGGVNVSLSSPDGLVVGGAVAGKLIASRPSQVVVCSFVYGNMKGKGSPEGSNVKVENDNVSQQSDKTSAMNSISPGHNVHPTTNMWLGSKSTDPSNRSTDIDLTSG